MGVVANPMSLIPHLDQAKSCFQCLYDFFFCFSCTQQLRSKSIICNVPFIGSVILSPYVFASAVISLAAVTINAGTAIHSCSSGRKGDFYIAILEFSRQLPISGSPSILLQKPSTLHLRVVRGWQSRSRLRHPPGAR